MSPTTMAPSLSIPTDLQTSTPSIMAPPNTQQHPSPSQTQQLQSQIQPPSQNQPLRAPQPLPLTSNLSRPSTEPPNKQSDRHSSSRSSSPVRPPVSPITPTFQHARPVPPGTSPSSSASLPPFPPPRQTFTHAQPNQVAIDPPVPQPIAFDSNPDAIALRSAIAVLQLQRRRALEDIQTLDRARVAALQDPDTFARDLLSGRVQVADTAAPTANPTTSASSSSPSPSTPDDAPASGNSSSAGPTEQAKQWTVLPRPQDVVRCPPINWNQYAVVGDSLEKLHAEQRAIPTEGTPATLGPGGVYEFKSGDGEARRYIGVAAPYTPGRDKLVDKKSRGGGKR